MFKRELNTSDILLILVNLIPLYGVWFEDWDARMVFLVYCLETVIIGLVNVLKMATVTLFVKSTDTWTNNGSLSRQSGWFFILFFILHYGIFVFVQTQMFFGVSGLLGDHALFGGYAKIPAILGNQGKLLLAIFITYYTVQTFFSFFQTGEYKTISMARLMFQPYMRIFVQQFVVIIGSLFLSFGAGKIFILVFILIKIFFELYINFDRYLDRVEKKGFSERTD